MPGKVDEIKPEDYGACALLLRLRVEKGQGMDASGLEELIPILQSAARLSRTVEDLAGALRRANARLVNVARMAQDAAVAPEKEEDAFRLIYNEVYSGELRKVLDRHGLLRDVNRPEMTQVFRDNDTTHGRCVECGAGPGEACTPNCEDRR